ncbi:MAG TPA: hypothetical protein VKE70_23065 [Candidatus Solibacter sp.]|nr:hypothetical protein [Candidatus Solibacter sp.]
MFEVWSGLGFDWVSANRAAWMRPAMLAISAVLIALLWKGNSWARNVIVAAFAWDAVSFLSTVGLPFAVGGGRLLGMLGWANLALELYAVYLLLQSDSLDWFRKMD